MTDSRGLCPTGWHVPTDSDWNKLVIFLDTGADTAADTAGDTGVDTGADTEAETSTDRGADTGGDIEAKQEDLTDWNWMDATKKEKLANIESEMLD